jgi:hypothetical protein
MNSPAVQLDQMSSWKDELISFLLYVIKATLVVVVQLYALCAVQRFFLTPGLLRVGERSAMPPARRYVVAATSTKGGAHAA